MGKKTKPDQDDVRRDAGQFLERHSIHYSEVVHVSTDHIAFLGVSGKPMTAWLRCNATEEFVFADPGFEAEPSEEADIALGHRDPKPESD